jgi:hypothetical protein
MQPTMFLSCSSVKHDFDFGAAAGVAMMTMLLTMMRVCLVMERLARGGEQQQLEYYSRLCVSVLCLTFACGISMPLPKLLPKNGT